MFCGLDGGMLCLLGCAEESRQREEDRHSQSIQADAESQIPAARGQMKKRVQKRVQTETNMGLKEDVSGGGDQLDIGHGLQGPCRIAAPDKVTK